MLQLNCRDCSQAWANMVGSVNYAQQAKMYLASGAAVVISSSTSTSPATSTGHTLATSHTTPLVPTTAVSCPAGCMPITSASSTITVVPTTVSSSTGAAASGCPVAGESCASGAMACAGYYYGQCANGVWVVRQCASGLACASSGETVYCDWASNVVIQECGSSSAKVKRDTDEYGVEFVGGGSSSVSAASSAASAMPSSSTGILNWLWSSSGSSTSAANFSGISYTPVATSSTGNYSLESTTSVSMSAVQTSAVQSSPIPYYYNSSTSSTLSSTSDANAPISDIESTGATPPTNVSLAIQPLNTTHFLAVLQASTLNNTPILTDWSFSFNSEYQILGTDRGNLTKPAGSDVYTITSIPIQEPASNMAVVVRLWGMYDSSTAEGMVGYSGVDTRGSATNGSFALFKRVIRWN